MNDQNYDPWQVAENAKEAPRTYFGQVDIECWFCALVKGMGKVPFDPQMHRPEDRRTAIQVSVTPLPSANVTFVTERGYVDFAHEWAGITLPSIKALFPGQDDILKKLKGKWIRYQMIPYGTYTKSDTGEEKTLTTFKFLATYNSEEEAEAAARALYGGGNGGQVQAETGEDPNLKVARAFLPALVAQSGGDVSKLATLLANNPLVSQHFNISSPEVVELLTPKAEKLPF